MRDHDDQALHAEDEVCPDEVGTFIDNSRTHDVTAVVERVHDRARSIDHQDEAALAAPSRTSMTTPRPRAAIGSRASRDRTRGARPS